jgi:hypothetical protein
MTKVIKKLRKIDVRLKDKKVELREAEISLYYEKFSTEEKRQEDIKEIRREIKDLLSLKFAKLETLQIEIEKIKTNVSSTERRLTLQIAS